MDNWTWMTTIGDVLMDSADRYTPKYDADVLLTSKHSCHLESEALTQELQIVQEFGTHLGEGDL